MQFGFQDLNVNRQFLESLLSEMYTHNKKGGGADKIREQKIKSITEKKIKSGQKEDVIKQKASTHKK